jgi:hypothetical protein
MLLRPYVGLSTDQDILFSSQNTIYTYAAVCWAAENGIVEGSMGYFRPDKVLTREDMTKILYQYAKYKSLDINVGSNFDLKRYSDSGDVSDYARSSVKWACYAGILSGVSNSSLKPKEKLTRAQAAVAIYRFITRI